MDNKMNVFFKGRLQEQLLAAGLPITSLYNDQDGNLAVTWTTGPTLVQQTLFNTLLAGFSDHQTYEEKLIAYGDPATIAAVILSSTNLVTSDERKVFKDIIDAKTAKMLAILRG